MKFIISSFIIIAILSSCGYNRYAQTGKIYPKTNETIQAYVDGRPVPADVEQIGLIEYNTRGAKIKSIVKAQQIAAEHGATAIYLPHKKGAVRTGIPGKGTFIVVK